MLFELTILVLLFLDISVADGFYFSDVYNIHRIRVVIDIVELCKRVFGARILGYSVNARFGCTDSSILPLGFLTCFHVLHKFQLFGF